MATVRVIRSGVLGGFNDLMSLTTVNREVDINCFFYIYLAEARYCIFGHFV